MYNFLTTKLPKGAWKSPSEVIPGLPIEFDPLVKKGLEEDPDDRWQTAGELAAALKAIPKQAAARMHKEEMERSGPIRPSLLTGPVQPSLLTGPVKIKHTEQSKLITQMAEQRRIEAQKKKKLALIVTGIAVPLLAVAGWFAFKPDSQPPPNTLVSTPGKSKKGPVKKDNPPPPKPDPVVKKNRRMSLRRSIRVRPGGGESV